MGSEQSQQPAGFLQSLLGPRTRSPTPPPQSSGRRTEPPVLEMLAKGMKQLQDLQAQTMARGTTSPSTAEQVKPGTLALAPLPELKTKDGAGAAALQLQDWLEVTSDVSENSGLWWNSLMDQVNAYSRWPPDISRELR